MAELTQEVVNLFCEMRDQLCDIAEALKKPASVAGERQVVFSLPYPTENIRFWQANVGAVPTQLLHWNDKRSALGIYNTGAALLYIAKAPSVTAATGFPLLGGAAISLDNYIGDIWVIAAAPQVIGVVEMDRE